MKGFSCLSILFLATSIHAQSVADLPSCSLACFASAVGETSCSAVDYACQCSTANAATIKQSVTACLPKSTCTLPELQKIQSWSNTFCPNVLASASSVSSAAPLTSSSSPTSSSAVPTSTSTSSPQSTSSSAPSVVPSSFGAGTKGTAWGDLPRTSSNADRGPAFEAVSIILVSVAALVLAFRFFARLYTQSMRQVVRGVGKDEWLAVISLLCTAGVTADIIVGTEYGFGTHLTANTTAGDLVNTLKLIYIFVILITASFAMLKLSILFLYLRMTPERAHHIIVYVMMGIVAAHGFSVIIASTFSCTPIHEFWKLGNPSQNSHCIKLLVFDSFISIWSVLEDIIIWALPIPVVWNLKVPLSRKSGLYTLVAISFIAVVCSVVRMVSVFVWLRSTDISWNYPLIPFLSNMEACVALMTSSVPAIYPLFRRPERKENFSNPPPPMREAASKAWQSQDSQDGTAVPSTAQTDLSSKRWSLLSKAESYRDRFRGKEAHDHQRHMTTIKSEGPRTELKSMFEEEEGREFVPGIAR